MIFGVATNEDRRQRSDNQSKEVLRVLDYIASQIADSCVNKSFVQCLTLRISEKLNISIKPFRHAFRRGGF